MLHYIKYLSTLGPTLLGYITRLNNVLENMVLHLIQITQRKQQT